MLYEMMEEASKKKASPEKRLEYMIRAYLKFGMDNPEYYEIMFSRNTPKYVDYKKTDIEPIAFHEKQTALQSADVAIAVYSEVFKNRKTVSDKIMRMRMLQIWCTLNGAVNLFNSRVLQEVEEDADAVIGYITKDIMKRIKSELEGKT